MLSLFQVLVCLSHSRLPPHLYCHTCTITPCACTRMCTHTHTHTHTHTCHDAEEFKAVSLLKRKKQGRKSDGQLGVSVGVFAEEQAEVVSHSSSQQSLTSYEDGDMVNFDPLGGLEPPVCSKSVDQLLEDAYDASKHVLGLTNKEEEEEVGDASEEGVGCKRPARRDACSGV